MAEMVLFHHTQGLTTGVMAIANEFRAAGHIVHVPDLYDGETFADIETGVAHAEAIGIDVIVDRGVAAVEHLTPELIYGGFSLGALLAQKLTQTRAHARGALLYHGGVPTSVFDASWPIGVPLQLHLMDGDEWAELDVAEALRDEIQDAELFVYSGSAHLFADSSLPDFEPDAARLLEQRTLEFLSRFG